MVVGYLDGYRLPFDPHILGNLRHRRLSRCNVINSVFSHISSWKSSVTLASLLTKQAQMPIFDLDLGVLDIEQIWGYLSTRYHFRPINFKFEFKS